MRNRKLKFKYLSVQDMLEDMTYLVNMGLAEIKVDPKTGEEGFQITKEGMLQLKNYEEVFSGKLN